MEESVPLTGLLIFQICTCCQFHEIFISLFLEIVPIALHSCVTTTVIWATLDKVDQSDYRKITIHSKKVGWGPISSSWKTISLLKAQNIIWWQNVSPDNVFLFNTLHTTPRRHISLTKAVIFLTYLQFLRYYCHALICNNMPLQVKNTTIVYVFWLHLHTVTDLSGNTHILQQVQKIMSLGC